MIEATFEPISLEIDWEQVQDDLATFGGMWQSINRLSMRNTPKTGRTYKRGSISHTASSVGNPPAIDTGRLFGSVGFTVRPRQLEMGEGMIYAVYLENKSGKVWRPHMEPAFDKTMKKFDDFLSDFVRTEE